MIFFRSLSHSLSLFPLHDIFGLNFCRPKPVKMKIYALTFDINVKVKMAHICVIPFSMNLMLNIVMLLPNMDEISSEIHPNGKYDIERARLAFISVGINLNLD